MGRVARTCRSGSRSAVRAAAVLLVCWTAWACTSLGASVSSRPAEEIAAKVGALPAKAGVADVDAAFGVEGRHQFSVLCGSTEYVCVSYAVWEPHIRYDAVFRDAKLVGIHERVPFAVETVVVDGHRVERRRPWRVEERIRSILRQKRLSAEELGESLAASRPRRGESNLTPALPLIAPGLAISAIRDEPARHLYKKLEKKYDGASLHLGATAAQVEAAWGRAFAVRQGVYAEHLYGQEEGKASRGLEEWPWVTLLFRDGVLVGVLRRDFIHVERAKGGEPQVTGRISCEGAE